jgi:hypothetical protein
MKKHFNIMFPFGLRFPQSLENTSFTIKCLAMRAIPKLAYQLKVAQVIASQMLEESVGTLKERP